MNLILLISTITMSVTNPPTTPMLPFLSPIFGDHMVLQRGKPNTIWGWTTPGQTVTVSAAGKTASGVADPTGKWVVKLSPPSVGGPYEVEVNGPQSVTLHDVLVGDVWLCTGQSNMEMGLLETSHAKEDIAACTDDRLRFFMVGREVAYTPKSVVSGVWKPTNPTTVVQDGWGGLTGVGYFFAKKLRKELDVPIGLVQDCWGGTTAEAWTSREGLREMHDFDGTIHELERLRREDAPVVATALDVWLANIDEGSRPGAKFFSPDYHDGPWKETLVPSGFPQDGTPVPEQVGWFRKEIEVPNDPGDAEATLCLGPLVATDKTWVNGQIVGFGDGIGHVREYPLPKGLLKKGRNVIAVRLVARGEKPGFVGLESNLRLDIHGAPTISLVGPWKYKMTAELSKVEPGPTESSVCPDLATVLYNGMIGPITPLAIRGVIWYQGESNAGRAYQYRTLLPALIADWRNRFGQGDFPFYIVSLANWLNRQEQPGDDAWAELREAQAITAAMVPNSGLAVTIDVGDPNDVHPKDKRTVGDRLARLALAKEFERKVVYSGPVYKFLEISDDVVHVHFSHAEGGLKGNAPNLEGFQIAGEDRLWRWAEAHIEGDTVVLRTPAVTTPVAVRYAWDMNPRVSLFNGAGFPAVPFRTDDWPMITQKAK